MPRVVTERLPHDSDDPAIWIDPLNPARSLVLGTDKAVDGGLYAFGLDGRIVRSVTQLQIPNNVAIAQGVSLGGEPTDLAVVTEAGAGRVRVFRLPGLEPVDGGGIRVFETGRQPWGVATWTRPSDGAVIVTLSSLPAPARNALWQYRIEDAGDGSVRLVKVREFGTFSRIREVEGIAVDAELGFVYYSDETHGVRKYFVDPESSGDGSELAEFARTGFAGDHEGISIMPTGTGTGYVLVSDQAAGFLRIFPREGAEGQPHRHDLRASVRISAVDSDGNDATAVPLPGFPRGLVVAMSTDRTFHYYAWEDIARAAGIELPE
jgi:3-phytase